MLLARAISVHSVSKTYQNLTECYCTHKKRCYVVKKTQVIFVGGAFLLDTSICTSLYQDKFNAKNLEEKYS